MANIAYKYRLYPNTEQQILFAKTFGCCRKIWNLMLADRSEAYQKDKTSIEPTPASYKKRLSVLEGSRQPCFSQCSVESEDGIQRVLQILQGKEE